MSEEKKGEESPGDLADLLTGHIERIRQSPDVGHALALLLELTMLLNETFKVTFLIQEVTH